MAKTVRPLPRYTRFVCVWCGKEGRAANTKRRTCSGACRQRLATYVRVLGWEPDKPPGAITAQAAIDIVIQILLTREREARNREKRFDDYAKVVWPKK